MKKTIILQTKIFLAFTEINCNCKKRKKNKKHINFAMASTNANETIHKHSHICLCCLSHPLYVSWSRDRSLKSCGASHSLLAGCLMVTPSYSVINSTRRPHQTEASSNYKSQSSTLKHVQIHLLYPLKCYKHYCVAWCWTAASVSTVEMSSSCSIPTLYRVTTSVNCYK